MGEILFLSAPLQERIWGGHYFKDVLKVTNSDEKIGEMWTVSALKEGPSIIKNGVYQGETLQEVYQKHPELFNFPSISEFPILVKIIHTEDDLSVQVHPDDAYARKIENQNGKTEGWLILDAKEDASIVVGHHAKNQDDLLSYIQKDDYEQLLCKHTVTKGEFYPIPAGTIHALGKKITLIEIQQSSNVTYRFFDYHRKDKDGQERELHVNKALDVTTFESYDSSIINCYLTPISPIWKNQYFEVHLYTIENEKVFDKIEGYLIVTVVEGIVKVDQQEVKLGDSFILCHGCKNIQIIGKGKIVTTHYLMH